MVGGETDNTCTRIEEVEHSYSNRKAMNCVPSQQDSKQPARKVALDVAISNTSKCLAYEATCRKCKKQVHYQSVCRSVTNLPTIRKDMINEEPFLGTIEIISTHSKDDQWMVELLLNGKPVEFKNDTGADITAVSEKYSRNWMESL